MVGRFIGVVRALTPFVAGSSRMAARRFIPATLVASGIWSATFSVLGYVFWRSFAQAAEIAKQGSLAFGALVILVIAAIVAYRVLHTREGRERLRSRLDRRAQRTTTSPSSASNS